MKNNFIAICISSILLNACVNTGDQGNNNSHMPDLLKSHIDSTIHPGDDFFNYANGYWLKKHPIPSTESGWGIFNVVEDENKTRLRKISEQASGHSDAKGSSSQMIGDFFSSGMDSATIEKNSLADIKPELEAIDKIKTANDVSKVMAQLHSLGINTGFSISIYQDLKNSSKQVAYIGQGGLGMPEKSYYFNTDPQTTAIRNAYPAYVTQLLTLGGINNASTLAQQIVQLETKIAKAHKELENLREPEKNYYPKASNTLDATYKNLPLQALTQQMGIKVDTLIISQPEFVNSLNTLLGTIPVEQWQAYLKFHVLNNCAAYLNTALSTAQFNFYDKAMAGVQQQRPRWKRVLDAQESALGEAMGQLYVKQYFNEKTKQRYIAMTDKVIESYAVHIKALTWMSDSTKQKALKKLNTMVKKVGYPDKWKTYEGMDISRNSYIRNVLNANKWHFNYEVAKLGKPVDKSEWGMTPQTYNAYYNPSNNEIVLPAAIFTAPGYNDAELDDAIMYGYVGASTIGHELTHGFDDEGRKFDEMGNLKNWWNKQDEAAFMKLANELVQQFNTYTLLGNKHPNGKATLGENIADLGGIMIALDAFKQTKQFKEGKTIEGLTPIQRYFLGYAYGWMQVRTPERQAQLLLTDVHAPIFLRVNGPMSNCAEWYKAFNVQSTNKMWRDSMSRVVIW
jgi:putative endopeptidase